MNITRDLGRFRNMKNSKQIEYKKFVSVSGMKFSTLGWVGRMIFSKAFSIQNKTRSPFSSEFQLLF